MYTRKFVHPNFECTFFRVYIFPSVHFSVYNFQGCSRCTIFRVYIFPDVQFSGVHFSGVQISVYKFNSFYHVMCSSQVFSWISFAYLTHDTNGRGSKAIGVDFLVFSLCSAWLRPCFAPSRTILSLIIR